MPEATETVQRDAPTKRVYQITLAGSNELQRWLNGTALTEERSRNLKVDWVTDVRPILLAATAAEEETLTACGGG